MFDDVRMRVDGCTMDSDGDWYFIVFPTFVLPQARTVGRKYLARFYSSIVSRLTLLRNLMAARHRHLQPVSMVVALLHLAGMGHYETFLVHSMLHYTPTNNRLTLV